jgi:hypothetical protein
LREVKLRKPEYFAKIYNEVIRLVVYGRDVCGIGFYSFSSWGLSLFFRVVMKSLLKI